MADKNLARGFIRPASSPFAAPVLFRKKKDGGLRLCMDYRGLNAVSATNAYPMPLIKDLLAKAARGKIFSKLDLRDAYFRVHIKEGDEVKTAFNTPLGQFEYLVMPFGLQGAPGVFMNLINEVLHKHLFKGVLVYLDDILIYSPDLTSHAKLVREVLSTLHKHKLFAKLSKCEFHKTHIDFLGYRISGTGLELDPGKPSEERQWVLPVAG
ncbi:PREDICTED: RNA-directed DNA polymerase homolog [Gekko japonicus]|uniref:ribonuclease H n=1 Tax=Gekko japonicus TaxID=146911 RepID=A0ABM1KWL7_GEKJA|nr:PREDICTED: RNA-directed DNA polymerase homolog [Gekko japonicus]